MRTKHESCKEPQIRQPCCVLLGEAWNSTMWNDLLKEEIHGKETELRALNIKTSLDFPFHTQHKDRLSRGGSRKIAKSFHSFLSSTIIHAPPRCPAEDAVDAQNRDREEWKRCFHLHLWFFRYKNNLGLPRLSRNCPYAMRASSSRRRARWHAAARGIFPSVHCETQTADRKM